ncbi:unnamed protein product [Protopolystoma xenopodis]|uniref:Uncharacterized protein n=1 Tax=Protopolystoma xenopodis TaxID=117903 RepID=A0A3S5FBU1_9PLAT|nr:unnamed protein product [Protopolystoma xenopodis]
MVTSSFFSASRLNETSALDPHQLDLGPCDHLFGGSQAAFSISPIDYNNRIRFPGIINVSSSGLRTKWKIRQVGHW